MTVAATSPDAKTVPVPASMNDRLHSTKKSLEARMSTVGTRIHRFPHRLRVIGGAGDCYVVPSVVAIGPYHRGRPHLREMEEIKHAAALSFCNKPDSDRTVEKVYAKVLSVAGDARRCYGDDKSLAAVSDADFATMMFLDGCFLMWYIDANTSKEELARWCYHSFGTNIFMDIFLLENQIPWVVLEALMEFRPKVNIKNWINRSVEGFFYLDKKKALDASYRTGSTGPGSATATVERSISDDDGDDSNNKAPHPHLLGLLRSTMIKGMPRRGQDGNKSPWILPRGAVYLAQIGVKITASRAKWFADMNVQEKLVSGELSLSPLLLGHVNACKLVNMAALEATGAFATTSSKEQDSDGYVVSSYLSTMAMLIDREEDVQELRRRGVLSSKFSNTETLDFIKGIGQHLYPGNNYYKTLEEIDSYIRRRPVRIKLHKFVHNNYKIIATVLSIAGVLASILKALYSLKKP